MSRRYLAASSWEGLMPDMLDLPPTMWTEKDWIYKCMPNRKVRHSLMQRIAAHRLGEIHAHSRAHTYHDTHARARARAHARMHTHTHARTHTHTHTRTNEVHQTPERTSTTSCA